MIRMLFLLDNDSYEKLFQNKKMERKDRKFISIYNR